MRSLGVLLAIGLGVGVAACGGAGKSGGSQSATSNAARTAAAAKPFVWPKPTHLPSIAMTRRFLKEPGLPIGIVREDRRIFAFYGYAPSAADTRAVTAVVKRYYALATAGDANRACSMISPEWVKAIPVDYGQFGSPYLRGAKTCQAVLSRMFRHNHGELTAPVEVTGVLAKGIRAYAVLNSTTMPASIIPVVHQHGVWLIDAPLGGRVPVAK